MSKCRKCGAELPDGTPSCPTCGSPAGDPVIPAPTTEPNTATSNAKPQKKHTGLKIVAIIICIFVILGLIGSCSTSCSRQAENTKYDWPTGPLAQIIPSMNKKCKSVSESEDSLYISVVDGITKKNYDTYISECKERGFTIDAKETNDNYEAYNPEGYQIRVSFNDFSSTEISIHLDAPKADGNLVWPTTGLATKLPNPNKTKGNIAVDSTSQFTAYIGEMDKNAYNAYVEQCIAAGFSVDYDKNTTWFDADNQQGDSLRIEYKGFNTVYISLYAAKTESTSSSAAPDSTTIATQSSGSSANQSSEPNTDFKKMMDDYEKFIDNYITFMKKYNDSSNTASMATDYAKYLSDYAAMVADIEAIDESALSDADAKYYIEVTTRVTKKLANASLE